jgi:hypothetical protein
MCVSENCQWCGELYFAVSAISMGDILPQIPMQDKHKHVSTTKTNRLMPFTKTVAVFCENNTEHRNTVCRQTAELQCAKNDTYIYHSIASSIGIISISSYAITLPFEVIPSRQFKEIKLSPYLTN